MGQGHLLHECMHASYVYVHAFAGAAAGGRHGRADYQAFIGPGSPCTELLTGYNGKFYVST